MNNLLLKIRFVFLPYLLISTAFIAAYSFLNWLLIIRFGLLSIKEEVVNYWLPIALGWAVIFFALNKRVKLLTTKTKKADLPMLFQLVSAFAIAIPTFIAQQYLQTATGKLTIAPNVAAISAKPITKYYELAHHYVDTDRMAFHTRVEITGKNNETMEMYLDIACPIEDSVPPRPFPFRERVMLLKGKRALVIINGVELDDNQKLRFVNPANVTDAKVYLADSAVALYGPRAKEGALIITTAPDGAGLSKIKARALPKVWLGIEFNKHISNNLSNKEKDEKYRLFVSDASREFSAKHLDDFVYLDKPGDNAKHKGFIKAIRKKYENATEPIVFEAVNEPFEARNGGKLGWIFKAYGIGAAIFLLILCFPKLDEERYKLFLNPPAEKEPGFIEKLLPAFSVHNPLFVTNIIAAINGLMFIIMVFAGLGFISFAADELLGWGANNRAAVLGGQWWRLLTSVFLHGGLMHLLGNFYGLYFAALFLEPKIGKAAYAVAYVFCGIAASLASIWWHPAAIGVGASGAIFGLYGVSITLILSSRVSFKENKGILFANLIFLGINLLLGILGNVDNAAHIGGLVAGLVAGLILFFVLPPPKPKRKYVGKGKIATDDEPVNPSL